MYADHISLRGRPIVTYWAEYYILQQVLNKNLHTTDEECANYAVQLMDRLEKTKSENAANDAIIDDVAAKAYIENFALDTFNRGDEAQRANKVTKQTADTFMAAATFLDLLSIWGEVDKEISSKSKFAKFHALRIAKAFKAGEDPNATNPVVEEPLAPPQDGIDEELRDLERQESGHSGGIYRPPTVESANNSAIPSRPESTVQGRIAPPPPLPQETPDEFASPPQLQHQEHQVSPIEPAESASVRQNSVGGGYFPNVASAPTDMDMMDSEPTSTFLPQQPTSPREFYSTAAQPPIAPPADPFGMSGSNRSHQPPPDQMTARHPAFQPMHSPSAPQTYYQAPPTVPPPAPAPVQQANAVAAYRTDDEATMAAQKHARWAISALNFEDVNTAVKELRLALQSLGAG